MFLNLLRYNLVQSLTLLSCICKFFLKSINVKFHLLFNFDVVSAFKFKLSKLLLIFFMSHWDRNDWSSFWGWQIRMRRRNLIQFLLKIENWRWRSLVIDFRYCFNSSNLTYCQYFTIRRLLLGLVFWGNLFLFLILSLLFVKILFYEFLEYGLIDSKIRWASFTTIIPIILVSITIISSALASIINFHIH